jgi:hypothetical protein
MESKSYFMVMTWSKQYTYQKKKQKTNWLRVHEDGGMLFHDPQEFEILSIKSVKCSKMHSTDQAGSYALA